MRDHKQSYGQLVDDFKYLCEQVDYAESKNYEGAKELYAIMWSMLTFIDQAVQTTLKVNNS